MITDLLGRLARSARLSAYSGIVFATFYGFFAYVHYMRFLSTGEWPLLLFLTAETVTAVFLFIRSDPASVSLNPLDWLVAIIGTFAPLFFRPASWGILPEASHAIAMGLMIQVLAVASLNRSLAMVAAKRKLKTGKMYSLVRHPIYASYCVTFTGYVLTYTTAWNLIIYVTTIGFLVARIFREEKHLSEDPHYRKYMTEVRYRMIPLLF